MICDDTEYMLKILSPRNASPETWRLKKETEIKLDRYVPFISAVTGRLTEKIVTSLTIDFINEIINSPENKTPYEILNNLCAPLHWETAIKLEAKTT